MSRLYRRSDGGKANRRKHRFHRSKLAAGVSNFVWRRLRKAYPGIEKEELDGGEGRVVFAKGLCWDKWCLPRPSNLWPNMRTADK